MINYNPKTWVQLIFKITKNDLLKKVFPYVVMVSIYTLLLLFIVFECLHIVNNDALKNINSVYSILGFVISILLAFRTSSAYDRWWEGRKALGNLNNTCRMLSIRISVCLPSNNNQRNYFYKLITAFAIVLKNKLQELPDDAELNIILKIKGNNHLPLAVLQQLTNEIEKLQNEKHITETQYLSMVPLINELANIIGVCERIKNTPIPYSYSSFIKKFIFIYTFTLPFAWMFSFGYFTILAVAFVFYVLVSLELLAEEIENPFGLDENDLPFDELVENIKINVYEILHKH